MSKSDMPDPKEPLVVVVGSINMDLVVKTAVLPRPGQTVQGRHFASIPGGKGANQAVAAARLGGRVHMIGKVGGDHFGEHLLMCLNKNQVDTSAVVIAEGISSGLAIVMVDAQGENSICVVAGANSQVQPEDLTAQEELISRAKVVVLQLELPVPTVLQAIRLARKHNVMTILDPAPAAADTPPELLKVDIITPNHIEAGLMVGEPIADVRSAKTVAAALLANGPEAVVVTIGEKGAVLVDKSDNIRHFPAPKVGIVDTTGAGDAFTGALSVAIARGRKYSDTIRYANTAGALACTKFGAQPAMPTRREVEELLASQS
jgi:ribokinase